MTDGFCGSDSTERTCSEIDPAVRKDADVMLASSAKHGNRRVERGTNSLALMELSEPSNDPSGARPFASRYNMDSFSTVTESDAPEPLARSAAVRTAARISSRSAIVETEKMAETLADSLHDGTGMPDVVWTPFVVDSGFALSSTLPVTCFEVNEHNSVTCSGKRLCQTDLRSGPKAPPSSNHDQRRGGKDS